MIACVHHSFQGPRSPEFFPRNLSTNRMVQLCKTLNADIRDSRKTRPKSRLSCQEKESLTRVSKYDHAIRNRHGQVRVDWVVWARPDEALPCTRPGLLPIPGPHGPNRGENGQRIPTSLRCSVPALTSLHRVRGAGQIFGYTRDGTGDPSLAEPTHPLDDSTSEARAATSRVRPVIPVRARRISLAAVGVSLGLLAIITLVAQGASPDQGAPHSRPRRPPGRVCSARIADALRRATDVSERAIRLTAGLPALCLLLSSGLLPVPPRQLQRLPPGQLRGGPLDRRACSRQRAHRSPDQCHKRRLP